MGVVAGGMIGERLKAVRGSGGRPRLLYVARHIPYVPSYGGVTRSYYQLRAAAEIADVTLLGAEVSLPCAHIEAIRPFCQDIQLVPPGRPRSSPLPSASARPLPRPRARVLDVAHNVTHVDPFSRTAFDRPAIQQAVRDLLRATSFDAVFVDYTEIAMVLRGVVRAWGGPSIAGLMDVLSVLEWQRQQATRREMKRRRPSLSDWQVVHELRSIERDILRSFTRTVTVSAVDAAHLRRIAAGARIDVAPNGVDVAYFDPVASWPCDPATAARAAETLIFTGQLAYRPNVDALRFFLNDIWPVIRSRRPRTRFWIVGATPTPEVQAMADRDDVHLFASVDDVRPYLAGSAVAVVPLRMGSGTRLKILEALAAERPVVSTTLGAEGLDLKPGRDLLLADTAMAFADAVVALLERPDDARELADHGRDTVRRLYSWDVVMARFQSILARAMEPHGAGPAGCDRARGSDAAIGGGVA